MNFWQILLITCLLLTVAACGVAAPAGQSPAAISTGASSVAVMPDTPTSMPVTQEAVAASTDAAPTKAASTSESVDWLTVEGKTADNLPYRGNPDARVTLIDYSDFLWGECRSYVLGTEPKIEEIYVKTGQVKLVFNPLIDLGEGSRQSHQAAACAGEQGMFWPMHDLLFEQQSALYSGDVVEVSKELAAQLPLDQAQFNTCLDEQRTAELVQSQDEHRRQLGIRTRPTFDINGQLIVGAQAFEAFQSVIEPLLGQ